MRIKNRIRQNVSQIFDILIPENKWQEYLDLLDRDGHPNRRELMQLILAFSNHLEVLEETIEDLYFQIELLEGKSTVAPKTPDFKLRTPIDVDNDLDKLLTPETTRFYVSADDWKVLEKTVDNKDPEKGYGKEVDPKDGVEKICLYYKGLPIFKK